MAAQRTVAQRTNAPYGQDDRIVTTDGVTFRVQVDLTSQDRATTGAEPKWKTTERMDRYATQSTVEWGGWQVVGQI